MQGPRNRCRRKRQYIHVPLHLLDLLLVGHTKALLLIYDQKPQILEGNILGQKPVGTNDNIHFAPLELFNGLFLLCGCAEPRHHFHIDRIISQSFPDGIVMLLCQYGGWHQKCHLFIVIYRLEGSPNRHFCLTVPHIAADQTVHHPAAFHIPFCRRNSFQLICRLLIRKHLLELCLPDGVRTEPVSRLLLTLCVQLHQLSGNLLNCSTDSGLCLFPFHGVELVKLWLFGCILTGILLQNIQCRCRNVKIPTVSILNFDEILGNIVYLDLLNTTVNTETVVLMNHKISYIEFIKALDHLTIVLLLTFASRSGPCAKDITLSHHYKTKLRIGKSF